MDECTVVPYGISVDMDSEFAVKLGAGLDYYFTENVALNLEGSYMWSDTTGRVDAFGTHAQVDLDGDMWMLGGGLKCRF